MFFDASKITDLHVQNIPAVHIICPHIVSDLASLPRRNLTAMYRIISNQWRPNQPPLSGSFHAASHFSTTHLAHPKKGHATEAPHLLMGLTKHPTLSHIPCNSQSSDTSHKPSHYLAVKFAGGKVFYCELKPLVNFHEDDLSKKMEKGWCALCDLRPVEKKGKGKLIGAVEWDGERFKSILREHLDSVKFLQQELHHHGEKEEEIGRDLEAEELTQLEQQRLELEEGAMKKVNLLEWALLGGLAVIMGVFIRYENLLNIHNHDCVRLTWWDWDWDAVEPFSFVFMFSLLIAGFAYFVLTKKDLTYEGARRRAMNILFTRCLFCVLIISFEALRGELENPNHGIQLLVGYIIPPSPPPFQLLEYHILGEEGG